MFVLIKSWTNLKLGHVGSKTRSPGQILEKSCVRCRGHIFSLILMKLSQNVCLDKISNELEIGSCGVKKTKSLGQILETPCVRSRCHIFNQILVKFGLNVLIKSWTSLKLGHVGSKTRSLGQILEKPCVCCRGHIFSQILVKCGQNVCLDKISNKIEIGSYGVKN